MVQEEEPDRKKRRHGSKKPTVKVSKEIIT